MAASRAVRMRPGNRGCGSSAARRAMLSPLAIAGSASASPTTAARPIVTGCGNEPRPNGSGPFHAGAGGRPCPDAKAATRPQIAATTSAASGIQTHRSNMLAPTRCPSRDRSQSTPMRLAAAAVARSLAATCSASRDSPRIATRSDTT